MKKLSYSLSRWEIALGWGYLLFEQLLLPSLLVLLFLIPSMGSVAADFAFFAVNFIATTIIFRRLLAASAKNALQNTFALLRTSGQGFLAYYAMSLLLGVIYANFLPDFGNVNDANISALIQDNFVLMAVSTTVLAPVAEELLFRGLAFGCLQHYSRIAAYTVSTVLFCLLHVVGYIGQFDFATLALCFIQYIPASICLAWSYEKADSIFAPILIHIAVNQISLYSM